MDKAIIVDLDGTLTNLSHRLHLVQDKREDMGPFHEEMINDSLNQWCADIITGMQGQGFKVLFVTGRSEQYRSLSEKWLLKFNISYDHLFMRSIDDEREDPEVKEEIFLKKIKNIYQVHFVLDDRKSVVKRWRELGLVCLQCDWGDF